MLNSHNDVETREYGGYYYIEQPDGQIAVRLPGSHEFFATLPNYEMFTRFADQANNLFVSLQPGLQLHLTGCRRCQRSVDSTNNYFSPCKTGGPMILAGRDIAQEVSRKIANEFAKWWEETEQQRLQPDAEVTAEGT